MARKITVAITFTIIVSSKNYTDLLNEIEEAKKEFTKKDDFDLFNIGITTESKMEVTEDIVITNSEYTKSAKGRVDLKYEMEKSYKDTL